MWYVTKLVSAVMKSNYWQSCAIIIVWDDYGGFYDQVAPPQVNKFGPRRECVHRFSSVAVRPHRASVMVPNALNVFVCGS
jgi:phospholipase C